MPDPFTHFEQPTDSSAGPGWLEIPLRWFHKHARAVLIAGGVFHVVVLASMIAIHATPLVVGETVRLRVEPVDPRDLFRGDYVILTYEISDVEPEDVVGVPSSGAAAARWDREEWLRDRTLYVTLEPEPDGRHYRGGAVSLSPPESGKYIRGRYDGGRGIHFGIEAWYVQEGEGLRYEEARNTRQLSADVAVTSWGQAKLRGLVFEPSPSKPSATGQPVE